MEEYLKKVHALVPAEMLAAFLAVNLMLPKDHNMDVVALIFVLFLMILYLYIAHKNSLHHTFMHVCLVALTIPIWAMNVASSRARDLLSEQFQLDPDQIVAVANVLLIAIVLLLPLSVKQEVQTDAGTDGGGTK
ncbi:MAG TPA: hypothetical protein VFZ91_07905 [Allosphingosinicella sp.]